MDLPKACLFDLDGVLLDTEGLHSQAWSKAAEFYETKLSKAQLNVLKGRRRVECAEQIVKWLKNEITAKEFLDCHKPISESLLSQAKAMGGAHDLVQWCHKNNMPMALVTSSTAKSVDLKTRCHEWLELIRTRVEGDDKELEHGKPQPDPFLLAAKRLDVNPKSCWVIEDSLSGIKSGLTAGCVVWALGNSNIEIKGMDNIDSRKRIFYISELEKLLSVLKNINSISD